MFNRKKNTIMDYIKNANSFAKKNNVKLDVLGEPEHRKYFPDDKELRYVFKIKLTRNKKQYTFTFGQSLFNGSKKPNMYDVLACLVKYDTISYSNFIAEYGYNDNSKAEKIYKAVKKEWEAVERLFSDVLDDLREIH